MYILCISYGNFNEFLMHKFKIMKVGEFLDDISFLLASNLCLKIMFAISELSISTPTLIAKSIKCSPSNVSTKLIVLRRRGLAICVTPDRRKGRIYKLTKKGRIVLRFIAEADSKIKTEKHKIEYAESQS